MSSCSLMMLVLESKSGQFLHYFDIRVKSIDTKSYHFAQWVFSLWRQMYNNTINKSVWFLHSTNVQIIRLKISFHFNSLTYSCYSGFSDTTFSIVLDGFRRLLCSVDCRFESAMWWWTHVSLHCCISHEKIFFVSSKHPPKQRSYN